MSSRVCVTGHIEDPIPCHLSKSRASFSSGRFPPSFIHQVIIITGLNIRLYVLALKMALDADRAYKTSTQTVIKGGHNKDIDRAFPRYLWTAPILPLWPRKISEIELNGVQITHRSEPDADETLATASPLTSQSAILLYTMYI